MNHLVLVIGFVGQALFGSRFLVQWFVSEARKESVIPVSFWILSLCGGVVLLTYAIIRRDPVFIVGQLSGLVVYTRNLMLIRQRRHALTSAA